MTATSKDKFFHPGSPLGWQKGDRQAIRRKNALNHRHNNAIRTAHALLALSNVSRDEETKRLAKLDATYFFNLHKRRQEGRGRGQGRGQ